MRIPFGHHVPGFGHQVTSLCFVLHYCRTQGLYPVLMDDASNTYGRWTDTFEPFWEPEDRTRVLGDPAMSVTDVDLNDWHACRRGLFGDDFRQHPAIAQGVKEVFHAVFRIRPDLLERINEAVDGQRLAARYGSVQIRRGDKHDTFKKYARTSNRSLARKLTKGFDAFDLDQLYVITDDYRTYEALTSVAKVPVFTRCDSGTRGDQEQLRTSPNNLFELLVEIHTAIDAVTHFHTIDSEISQIIRLLRNDEECHHLFEPAQTVETYL